MRRFQLLGMYVLAVIVTLGVSIMSISSMRTAVAGSSITPVDETPPAPADTTAAPATAPAQDSQVRIDNFAFNPKELTIPAGTKVTWVNKDDVPHTATSKDKPPAFDSKALDTDDTYSFTFSKPGTYQYYCKVHPHMTGTVIVK